MGPLQYCRRCRVLDVNARKSAVKRHNALHELWEHMIDFTWDVADMGMEDMLRRCQGLKQEWNASNGARLACRYQTNLPSHNRR